MMLSPFSVVNLIFNARKILSQEFDEESLVLLLLSLVAIPYELRELDATIKRVSVPTQFAFIRQVVEQDKRFREPEDRIGLCQQYSTILWYWINSMPAEDIVMLCGLDPSADAALLEESLPNDAHWVLGTLASMPNTALRMTQDQRRIISELAVACKFGSRDPIVHELLGLELRHMGRNTALELAKFMHRENKGIRQLTESDLLKVFPEHQKSAKLLYAELVGEAQCVRELTP